PGDANPENFDPPMSTLKNASESSLYMQMGHLPWENSIIERIAESNPEIKVIDTSTGIDLIYGTHDHAHHHAHENDGIDPHTWTSIKNAKIIASNMYQALVDIDSVNIDYYSKRYELLTLKLDSLDNEFTRRLLPIKGKSVIVWHPSLSYFARDYGINQIAIGMENKEATPKGLQKKMEMAAAYNPLVFFVQPEMDGAKSEAVVKQSGAKKIVIQPLAYDWLGEIEKITDSLTDSIN
ncbi:MAG: zinc ABC transporter substrate-binding protein, partial [Paramuribaculum sp.]|nr:zinc ABC transporter substrate-binding protein [Paramuribaculum sp.]